ncbi:hypothetical protein [Streptomyces sp. NPDC001070]
MGVASLPVRAVTALLPPRDGAQRLNLAGPHLRRARRDAEAMAESTFHKLLATARADKASIRYEPVNIHQRSLHLNVPLARNRAGLRIRPK